MFIQDVAIVLNRLCKVCHMRRLLIRNDKSYKTVQGSGTCKSGNVHTLDYGYLQSNSQTISKTRIQTNDCACGLSGLSLPHFLIQCARGSYSAFPTCTQCKSLIQRHLLSPPPNSQFMPDCYNASPHTCSSRLPASALSRDYNDRHSAMVSHDTAGKGSNAG